ncbi:MAG: glycosyltransferase, partial [Deltaproteobacteria bacterium]
GRRGHRVDIYTRLRDPSCQQTMALYSNVRLIHLRAGRAGGMNKLDIYPHLAEFFQELEKFRLGEGLQYDLVHSHYWLSGRVGDLAQNHWRVPHIVTFHTLGAAKNDIFGVEQEPVLRVTTERHLSTTCHRVLAGTKREKGQLVSYYGASPDSIGVVPCGVNLRLFHPRDKAKAREQLGFNDHESLLLYVGRFAPSKGADKLLAALPYLRKHRPIRLLIVGGNGNHSPEAKKLERLSHKLEIQDHVNFVGRIEQEVLPTYYNAADMLVVPSRYESFGLVALESVACGTPVVATRVGAMDKILREGETGHVVENGSPRALADGIEALILAENGLPADVIRESILEFSWENVASAMIEEYEGVLRKHRIQFVSGLGPLS